MKIRMEEKKGRVEEIKVRQEGQEGQGGGNKC
jgi:hypothetical protein